MTENMRPPLSDLPIAFENVTVTEGSVTILDRLSLTISPGEPTFVIGPNGSGKTTFLRAAMGLVAPTEGRVTWGGRDGVSPHKLAFVFQRPVMLRRSAESNVRFTLSAAGVPRIEHDGRVAELFKLVGLDGLQKRSARRLSGGEQQRLAIARALARDPSVIFLDEPTASLDPAATKAIEDIVRTITARGVKAVLSTHDLGQARRLANDIIFLHRGRIIETGATSEFFESPRSPEARSFIEGDLLV